MQRAEQAFIEVIKMRVIGIRVAFMYDLLCPQPFHDSRVTPANSQA